MELSRKVNLVVVEYNQDVDVTFLLSVVSCFFGWSEVKGQTAVGV